MRYLRVKKDGFIYEWSEILSKNPACEEITEEQAFPERFLKPAVVAEVQKVRRRKGALDLSTADIPQDPVYNPPELAADASRGLP
jgi:hypothetical protein